MKFLALAALGAVLLLARTADACGPQSCQGDPAFRPSRGLTVPANLPALWMTAYGSPGAFQPDASTVLHTSDGGVVPVSVEATSGGIIVRPTQPLVAGEIYRWEAHSLCAEDDRADAGPYVSEFSVAESWPLPTTPPTLTLARLATEVASVPTTSGACFEEQEAVVATFRVTPSSEMVPFLSTTAFALEVNGETWAAIAPGDFQLGLVTAMNVTSTCDRTLTHATTGPEPGAYSAVLVATIAGHPEKLRSSPVTFDLRCGTGGCGCSAESGGVSVAVLATFLVLRRRRATSASG